MSIRRMMLFTLGAKIKNLVQAFKERVLNTQGQFEAEGCLEVQLTQLDNQNLLDNASLIVTPNGYKETLLYAVEPNEVGTNLFLRSQEFDNAAWIKQGGSETIILPNVETAPNGTLTGDKMYPNTSGVVRGVFQINFPINTYRHSVYAKKGGKNFLYLYVIGSTASTGCWFNLDTGTIGTVGSSWSNATIENVGNGWYRCSATVSITNSTNFIYYFVSDTNNNVNVTANGTDGIFLWGAQLVPGSTITDYISTTDRAIINGTIGDMSVTRATTATRVNSDGFIEQVPYNLFQRSEEFETTSWTKIDVSITQNTVTAPNVTLTADTLRIGVDALARRHRLYQSFTFNTSTTYTTSYYLKKANHRWIQLTYVNDTAFGVSNWANFDLENGVIGNTGTGAIATIEDVGDGWYRCSVQGTTIIGGSLTGCEIIVINNTNSGRYPSYQSTVAEDVCYVWGAQLVTGAQAKDYFPTTNRFNVPRLDYSNGSCPSILVEPQRTNLVLRSEEFENASWVKNNSSILTNTAISPSNVLNADTYIGNGLNIQHFIYQNLSVTSGITYSISIYAKKDTNNFIQLCGSNTAFGVNCFANFDISNGTIGTIGSATIASIDSVGNGWYRLKITSTAIATTPVAPILISLITSSTSIKTETNNLSTSVYLWGAQLEAGTNATSYIPTVASTVTRNADVITNTNASTLIGQTEGTFFIDFKLQAQSFNDSVVRTLGTLHAGSNANRIQIYRLNNQLLLLITTSGINQVALPLAITTFTGQTIKIAVSYSLNNVKLFVNGVLVSTDTSATIPLCNSFNLGSNALSSDFYNGLINLALIFKTQLTDTECINLTTL